MTTEWQERLWPAIAVREIVEQATKALIAMDAERLEELAQCCADLKREYLNCEYLNREYSNCDSGQTSPAGQTARFAESLREVERDVKLMGCVLYETRANLAVLSRLHALRLREADVLQGRNIHEQARYRAQVLSGSGRMERAAEYGDN